MPSIKRNGISYSGGGSSSANGVAFDNTNSGLEATNVQDAISELNNSLNSALENINSTYSITHVIDGTLDYIKNGKERILVCNACTLDDVNAVDISDSIPESLSRNFIYSQYNNGLVNALVWYDTTNNKFAGNYRTSYGSSNPSSLSGTTVLNGQIRWFVA